MCSCGSWGSSRSISAGRYRGLVFTTSGVSKGRHPTYPVRGNFAFAAANITGDIGYHCGAFILADECDFRVRALGKNVFGNRIDFGFIAVEFFPP